MKTYQVNTAKQAYDTVQQLTKGNVIFGSGYDYPTEYTAISNDTMAMCKRKP